MSEKILQIGSGSMGTRRMRDLTARGDVTVALFDAREDRRLRAAERFGVQAFATLEEGLAWGPDALSISTPPDHHDGFIETALENGLHYFCEADIWTYDYREVETVAAEKHIVPCPSATLLFLPVVRELARVIWEELGGLHAYGMCLSVDERAWHPGEGPEYYARHRSTAPGREMVPFELIFLNTVFGEPVEATGTVRKCGALEMDSEDTWCLQLSLDNGATGQFSVQMASPQTARKGYAVGSNGYVEFDLIAGTIRRQFPGQGINDTLELGRMSEVLEASYADEIGTFVAAMRGEKPWPFSPRQGALATATLAAAEKSAVTRRFEKVDLDFGPAPLPDAYEITEFETVREYSRVTSESL